MPVPPDSHQDTHQPPPTLLFGVPPSAVHSGTVFRWTAAQTVCFRAFVRTRAWTEASPRTTADTRPLLRQLGLDSFVTGARTGAEGATRGQMNSVGQLLGPIIMTKVMRKLRSEAAKEGEVVWALGEEGRERGELRGGGPGGLDRRRQDEGEGDSDGGILGRREERQQEEEQRDVQGRDGGSKVVCVSPQLNISLDGSVLRALLGEGDGAKMPLDLQRKKEKKEKKESGKKAEMLKGHMSEGLTPSSASSLGKKKKTTTNRAAYVHHHHHHHPPASSPIGPTLSDLGCPQTIKKQAPAVDGSALEKEEEKKKGMKKKKEKERQLPGLTSSIWAPARDEETEKEKEKEKVKKVGLAASIWAGEGDNRLQGVRAR